MGTGGADASAGPGASRGKPLTPRVATTAACDGHFDYNDHAACMHRLKVTRRRSDSPWAGCRSLTLTVMNPCVPRKS